VLTRFTFIRNLLGRNLFAETHQKRQLVKRIEQFIS
jgi:hypothetical protein